MIDIRIEGLDEAVEYFDGLVSRLRDSELWNAELQAAMEDVRRYAVSVSPIVTGSYAGAHRVVMGAQEAILSIGPASRNTSTGQRVTRYAAAVEQRHGVYVQALVFMGRTVAPTLENIVDGN